MLSVSQRGISPYGGRHLEQFGTQSQASTLHRREVDLKADFFPFEDKLDHAAALRELRHVTNGQNGPFVESFDDPAKPAFFGGAHEQDLATGRFLRSGDSFGGDAFPTYGFTGERGIEGRPKRILAQDTDRERAVLDCDSGRPFDEAAEIVEIDSLDIVVSGLWALPPQTRSGHQSPHQAHN